MASNNPNCNVELWQRIWRRVERSSDHSVVYLYVDNQAVPRESSGCWLWRGESRNGRYGHISYREKKHHVHRLMWEIVYGRIPAAWEVDHLCRQSLCCNPDHLEPVTAGENRRREALHARKELCPSGHRLTDANVVASRGWRACRICINDQKRRWYQGNRERLNEELRTRRREATRRYRERLRNKAKSPLGNG